MTGVYTTRTTAWRQGKTSKPRVGLDRANAQQMISWDSVNGGLGIRTAFAAQNAVIKIAQDTGTVSGGTFTLTVTIPSIDGIGTAVTYTTGNIAYNADASTIEAALDTASPATVTDGHVAVGEENAAGQSDGYITFTCSDTVGSMPVFITEDDALLTGGGAAGAVSYTTYGQAAQVSKQALIDMNVVSGSRNEVGATPSWTKPESNGQSRPRAGLIKALALDCRDVDGDDEVWDAVLALYPEISLA